MLFESGSFLFFPFFGLFIIFLMAFMLMALDTARVMEFMFTEAVVVEVMLWALGNEFTEPLSLKNGKLVV